MDVTMGVSKLCFVSHSIVLKFSFLPRFFTLEYNFRSNKREVSSID